MRHVHEPPGATMRLPFGFAILQGPSSVQATGRPPGVGRMMVAGGASWTASNEILEGWQKDGIEWVRFELPDMHGTSRSKTIPIRHAFGYAERGLNMYGGTSVLDSRSDVVGGTLYHEERQYADQLLFPDPETAAVVPWADRTGPVHLRRALVRRHAPRCHAAAGVPQGAGPMPGDGLRARDRLRVRVLPAGRGDPRAAVQRLPHLQHPSELVRADGRPHPRADAQDRGRHHHIELRVRGVAVGDQLRPRERASRAPTRRSRSRTA